MSELHIASHTPKLWIEHTKSLSLGQFQTNAVTADSFGSFAALTRSVPGSAAAAHLMVDPRAFGRGGRG
jgi:hypothetical protein